MTRSSDKIEKIELDMQKKAFFGPKNTMKRDPVLRIFSSFYIFKNNYYGKK